MPIDAVIAGALQAGLAELLTPRDIR